MKECPVVQLFFVNEVGRSIRIIRLFGVSTSMRGNFTSVCVGNYVFF